MAYTIQINEEQRAILEEALRFMHGDKEAFPANRPIFEPGLLRDMLAGLAKAEAECPGALHGFTI